MLVPEEITEEINSLIVRLGIALPPQYIRCDPIKDAPINHCFPLVEEKVRTEGGQMVLGWQIWQTLNLLEAEFHSIWKTPDGDLVDIAPKAIPVQKILFLPDPGAIYENRQVNNIRVNITGNQLCDEFISICDTIFRIENRGKRAYQSQLILPERENSARSFLYEAKQVVELMMLHGNNRNNQCICGSGKKYKMCHGKKIAKIIKNF